MFASRGIQLLSPNSSDTVSIWPCLAESRPGTLLERLKEERTWWKRRAGPSMRWGCGGGTQECKHSKYAAVTQRSRRKKRKGTLISTGACSSWSCAQPPTRCCSLNERLCHGPSNPVDDQEKCQLAKPWKGPAYPREDRLTV